MGARPPGDVEELERRLGASPVGSNVHARTAGCAAAATTVGSEPRQSSRSRCPRRSTATTRSNARCWRSGWPGGRGCARLLAHDGELSALLIERLGSESRRARAAGSASAGDHLPDSGAVWVRVPQAPACRGAEKAEWLAEFIASAWEGARPSLQFRGDRHGARVRRRASGRVRPDTRCSCTATRTVGTHSKRVTARSSWLIPKGSSPNRRTIWPCRCASSTRSCGR